MRVTLRTIPPQKSQSHLLGYVSPLLGSSGTFKTDDEFAYGASLGLEIGLGDTFAIMGGLRWLKADIEPDGIEKIGIDPLFSRLGVALRF